MRQAEQSRDIPERDQAEHAQHGPSQACRHGHGPGMGMGMDWAAFQQQLSNQFSISARRSTFANTMSCIGAVIHAMDFVLQQCWCLTYEVSYSGLEACLGP